MDSPKRQRTPLRSGSGELHRPPSPKPVTRQLSFTSAGRRTSMPVPSHAHGSKISPRSSPELERAHEKKKQMELEDVITGADVVISLGDNEKQDGVVEKLPENRNADTQSLEDYKKAHPEWYYTAPEQPTLCQRMMMPFWKTVFYFRRVASVFGVGFLLHLFSVYFCIKGLVAGIIGNAQTPYFQQFMNLSATRLQVISTVVTMPWCIKALIGMLSDLLPIRGIHKGPYIAGAAVLGTISCIILGSVQFSADMAEVVCILMFLVLLEASVADILTEGKYAELMGKHTHTGSDLVTFVWLNVLVGGLVASQAIGPMGDQFNRTGNFWYIKGMFLLAAPIALQVIGSIAAGFLNEHQLQRKDWGFQREKFAAQKPVFIYGLVMGLCVLGMAVVSLLNNVLLPSSSVPSLVYALAASVVFAGGAFVVLPRRLAKCNMYMFLSAALYVNIGSTLSIFYLGTEECVPNGPHFDLTFYQSISSLVSSFTGLIGVMIFQAVMSDWEFRPCFWVTLLLQVLAGLIDIVMVMRWNLVVGIPDKVTFMLGFNIVAPIIQMMNFMPGVVLTSKLCPPGMESTIYALLAGMGNFGQQVSSYVGVFLIQAFGVKMSNNGPCTYNNLPILIVVCHVALPLLCVGLVFVLIPKARLSDSLLPEGNDWAVVKTTVITPTEEEPVCTKHRYAGVGEKNKHATCHVHV